MKAIESISSANPKIQCQVSVEEEKAVLFLIVILHARIEGSNWNNWFWQECVKTFALFCAEVGRKGSLLGKQQQQIRQKWKLLIEILFGVNMRSMSTCLLVLQFLNISWKARRLFLWRRLIQESLGLFSQRINLAESSIYHRLRRRATPDFLLLPQINGWKSWKYVWVAWFRRETGTLSLCSCETCNKYDTGPHCSDISLSSFRPAKRATARLLMLLLQLSLWTMQKYT